MPSLGNFWGYGLLSETLSSGLIPSGNPKVTMIFSWDPKVFFTVFFHNLEDKDKIFENEPYFFNSIGLYLRFWTKRFILEK
jgi:hypothetical protein